MFIYIVLGNYIYLCKALPALRNESYSTMSSGQWKQLEIYSELLRAQDDRPWFLFYITYQVANCYRPVVADYPHCNPWVFQLATGRPSPSRANMRIPFGRKSANGKHLSHHSFSLTWFSNCFRQLRLNRTNAGRFAITFGISVSHRPSSFRASADTFISP